ncbi:hypothetical protein M0Q97_12595, partial [Candidatus Dojkabacteria bacterium]|nr:hypothetical protein [Candidatus Dojkabacteria bacterium]
MSRIDNKYIEALGNFTDALGEIVELLKEQQKKGTEDVVNNFAQTPMGDLSKVVDDLKTIKQTTTKGFKDIKDQNNIILKKIESLKQQKEAGSFDKIEDPKNKNKIVDGIKVVTLIAGGVLAMGMAFKLIGKVDFLSVIALSGSIFIMSKTFSQLMEFKNLKYIDVLKIASILPIMSFAILASAFLISKIPKISFSQGLSMIFVGGSLGVATWLLLKTIKNVEIKDFGKVFLLPFVLPTISIALLLSAYFISKIPNISLSQGLSMIFIGGSLGVATWLLLKAIKNVEIKDFGKVFLLPFVLPTISMALLASSFFISKLPDINFSQGLSMIFIGATLGVATWAILNAIKNIDLKKDWKTIVTLPFILPIIATAIFLSSLIIQKIPIIDFKTGLSLLFVGSTLGVATWVILNAIKNIDIKKDFGKIFLLPFILPTISLALFLSSLIIQKIPIIDIKTGLSLLFISATLGIATWLLLKAIKNVNIEKEWKTIFALPFVLPTIALALFLSANIIQNFPIIGFREGLSILFVGVTLGVATWLLLKAIKNVDIVKNKATIFALPWILPVIALALTISSSILQDFEPIKKPLDFLISTALIGISVLIFSPVIKNMGKMKFDDILKGTVSIPLVALAIVGAAYVFRELPTDMKYPDFMWSLGVGLSILVFAPVLWLVGKFGLDKMIDGMVAIPLIAGSILLTSLIFQLLPNDMKYPEIKWTLGTGLSLLSFGGMAIAIGLLLTGPQMIAAAIGLAGLIAISSTIVAVSYILGAGKYENYPSLKWSTSVGLSLLAFSVASVAALAAGASNLIGKLFTGGTDPLVALAQRMVNVANKLNEVDWTSAKHPSKEYAEGVGGLLLAFAGVFAKISRVEGFNKIITSLFGGGQSDNFTTFIDNAANAII